MSLYDDCYAAYKGELQTSKKVKDEVYYTYVVYNCYSENNEERNGLTFKSKIALEEYLNTIKATYGQTDDFCILNQYNKSNKTYYYIIVNYKAYKQATKLAKRKANAGGGYFGAGWPKLVNFILCLIWPIGYLFGIITPWITERFFCYKFTISFARLCLGIFPLTALFIWIFDLIGLATDNELKGCSSNVAHVEGYGAENIWVNHQPYNIIYHKK